MLSSWIELLPLFLIRLIASSRCEKMCMYTGSKKQTFLTIRPDVLIHIKETN